MTWQQSVQISKCVTLHTVDYIMVFRNSQSVLYLEVYTGIVVYPLLR